MLEKQVIYDRFNASFESKPFKVSKIRVDLFFLSSRDFVRCRQSAGRRIFELDSEF